jgi:hypothetical protein
MDRVTLALNAIRNEATYGNSDVDAAIMLAQSQLRGNPHSQVMLFTCRDYVAEQNITVKNMSQNEWNVAIIAGGGGSQVNFAGPFSSSLVFWADVVSYNTPAHIREIIVHCEIEYYTSAGQLATLVMPPFSLAIVETTSANPFNRVVFETRQTATPLSSFRNATFSLFSPATNPENADDTSFAFRNAQDSLAYDNVYHVIAPRIEPLRVQLVSPRRETWTFEALRRQRNIDFTFVNLSLDNFDEYGNPIPPALEGFDLYVFEEYVPPAGEIPTDGSSWFINPDADLWREWHEARERITIHQTFQFNDHDDFPVNAGWALPLFEGEDWRATLDRGRKLTRHPDADMPQNRILTRDLVVNNISITRYNTLLYGEGSGWSGILATGERTLTNQEPIDDVLMAVRNVGGIRTVITAFDQRFTDMPATVRWPLLVSNVFESTSQVRTLPERDDCTAVYMTAACRCYRYEVGDNIHITARGAATSVTVSGRNHPPANASYVPPSFGIYDLRNNNELRPYRELIPGFYTITQTFPDDSGRANLSFRFFVRIPPSASVFSVPPTAAPPELPTIVGAGDAARVETTPTDFYIWLAAGLLLLVLIEWGMQYREQF